MASQEALINECRALCIESSATRENIWAKCSVLGQIWSEADSDEAINVAITQIDEIINTNNETQHPFTLALLMIRAELERSLKVNNHIEQSKSLYFGLIGSMISQMSEYNPPLHKRKNFVANLGKLLSTIRGYILSKSDESIQLVKQIISWLGVDNKTLTPFHQTLCMLGLAKKRPRICTRYHQPNVQVHTSKPSRHKRLFIISLLLGHFTRNGTELETNAF